MKRLSPMKAIRAKCLDCCCDQQAEVRRCEILTCPLWRYRMGREEHDELYVRKPMSKKQRENVEKLRVRGGKQ
jgi:hypothetical protein